MITTDRHEHPIAPSRATTFGSYMPSLDGIRALAITGVLMAHFLANTSLQKFAPLGRLGVILFFVMSGFLITKILIDARIQAEAIAHTSRWRTIGCFYARRSLRIFPIYYISIFILSALDYDMRTDLFWYMTSTQNLPPGFGKGMVAYAGHLWSLAVEEQFYLVLPWLVLFFSRRVLAWVLWCLVIAAICYKFIGSQSGMNLQALIWTVLDLSLVYVQWSQSVTLFPMI